MKLDRSYKKYLSVVFLAIYFLNKSLHAEPLLERKASPGNRDVFTLSDKSCDDVSKHINVLVAWTKKIDQASKCDQKAIVPKKVDGKCVAEVSNCLPLHVLKYQGLQPKNDGPNCWNLSLVMKNILPGLRYSTPDEMAYYMRSPLCRALKNNEKREVGDVGAIRGVFEGMKEESHGFIYLSDDLSYSKNGFSKTSPYEVQSAEKVLSIYGVPSDLKCRKNELDLHSNCENAVSYFRCQSFDEFLSKVPNLKAPTTSSIKHVIHFEQCLERVTVNGMVLRPEAVGTLENSIKALVDYLNEKKSKSKKNKSIDQNENFVIGSLYLRLSAIGEQLEVIDASNEALEVGQNARKAYELAEMIKSSHKELATLVEGINQ